MKIKMGRRPQVEAEEPEPEIQQQPQQPSFIERKLRDKEKEIHISRSKTEALEKEFGMLQEIGDSAMYISDILDMINEYRKKGYTNIEKLLDEMEIEILTSVEQGK